MLTGGEIGAYRVLHQIGEGGMGAVFLAEHVKLGRRAAIKVLRAEYSHRSDIVARFFNEARAATMIADPGIVQIFDFGHHTDGSAYIVMELLNGEPLDKRLCRLGALDVPDALRIMRQVASTLGAAHASGIVHRDLKPENIFMVRDPEVAGGERAKVLDFGIAKLADDQAGVKTQTSAVMGTPAYMSPEQCRGAGQVDQRSDVYALGCVLFRLLCGRTPFDAEGAGELIAMHLREPPPVPSTLRPGIPEEVDQVVLQCLAKDPAHRFTSGAALATALGALAGPSPQIAMPAGRYAGVSARTTLSTAAGAGTAAPMPAMPRSRKRLAIATSLSVGVAVSAIGIIAATRGGANDNTNPASSARAETPSVGSVPAPAMPSGVQPAPASSTPDVSKQDPTAEVVPRMRMVLEAFVVWSREHAGAPCPDVATLGVANDDPWGHPFQLSCVDQPAGQIAGVISTGPDGAPGTADDIASWQLGRDVTDAVRGPRWVVATATTPATALPAPRAVAPPSRKPAKASTSKPANPTPAKPTKAVEVDENGLPIAR